MKAHFNFVTRIFALLTSLTLALPLLGQSLTGTRKEVVAKAGQSRIGLNNIAPVARAGKNPSTITRGTGVATATDQLVLITSQAAQGANDSVNWSQLGVDGTLLNSSLSAASVNGLAVTGSLAGPGSVPAVVCAATNCSWTGNGFTGNDTLIWTSDASNGGNGPLTLSFGSGIAGGGLLIQSDAPGQFTAQIDAFNSSTLLGTFTVTSNAAGDATYIGVKDQTGANITSLTFSLKSCANICSDFAIDTAYLNQSGSGNTLTVSVTGSGSGTVTSSPAGINCPGTCTANFPSTASVTLTESPAAGSGFTGWNGACTGTGACSVSMASAQSVTANFQPITQTNTTLTVSSAQANAGAGVTLTAKVAPVSGSTTPTGTVTFNNGSTGLGAIQLVGGTATMTTNSLAPGSYSVTATYSGDTNSATSSSTAVALMVVDISIAASPTSLTASAGQSATTTLTLTPTPLTGFSATASFSCSGLPAQSTCSFTPTSVTANGAAATTKLSIQTAASAPCTQQAGISRHGSGWAYALFLPGVIGIVSLKRKRLTNNVRFLGFVAVLSLFAMGGAACSMHSPGGCSNGLSSGTPTGTASVTVTATTSGSSPISKQITIALTVQ